MVMGRGEVDSAPEDMDRSYGENVTDEFVKPSVVMEGGKPLATIDRDDSIIFFNFRPDRAREITRSLIDVEFDGFPREKGYFPLKYITMTQYDATFENVQIAYAPRSYQHLWGVYKQAWQDPA